MSKKPVVLMVLDGCSLDDNCNHDAACERKTPIMDQLMNQCPFMKGNASEMAVDLPDGQMGNSEVGHLSVSAGRIVYRELTRITKSIQDGDFFQIPEFLGAMENCKKHDSALHLFGLVSDGGVYSHNTRIYGLLELMKRHGLDKVYVHCFLDDRDTPPASGKDPATQLEEKMVEISIDKVATITGRHYATDRDRNWDRARFAYDTMTKGEDNTADGATGVTQNSYDNGKNDRFMTSTMVVGDGRPVGAIKDHGSIIFYNFRPDRTREITRAFCDDTFDGLERERRLDVVYVCSTDYDRTISNELVAFREQSTANTFSEFLAAHGKTQVRIVETEKYAHMTFFLDGGIEEPDESEDRVLVSSPKEVATYNLELEMSAPAAYDKSAEAIKSDKYDVIVVNFVNPDTVGHTGVGDAAIEVIGAVDACVGKAVDAIKKVDSMMFICADHGNTRQLVDYQTSEPFTAHVTNPVPFILANMDLSYKLREGGCLVDIIPTLIGLMGLEQLKEMTGASPTMK